MKVLRGPEKLNNLELINIEMPEMILNEFFSCGIEFQIHRLGPLKRPQRS